MCKWFWRFNIFKRLDYIEMDLASILEQGEEILAKEIDLENDLQAVADGVAVLAQEIADLKNATSPVTQEQLDALDAKAQAIVAAINAAK